MFPRGLNACIGMVRLTNACEEPWPHSHIDAGMGHKFRQTVFLLAAHVLMEARNWVQFRVRSHHCWEPFNVECASQRNAKKPMMSKLKTEFMAQ